DRMEMILIRMRQYASEMLEAAHISFTIEMDEQCNSLSLPIEKRKDFYLIFKEAINNLAKYSQAGEAHIKINCSGNLLILAISDNGVGFSSLSVDEGNGATGNGLINMQARAKLLNGQVKITSKQGEGTHVDLRFPLSP
ncbi:MAG TPA: ATP-binding protein, partial [Bacteroidia bacterium]|nr:ATP-binding protein [Bacteroidia bacterium]